MGIDHFNTWLVNNYKEALVVTNSVGIYDYIYIDINHLLHNSIHDVSSEDNFKKKLEFYLDHIFNRFICTRTVVFAVDGSSPYSKLMTQRKRRIQMMKTTYDDNIIDDIIDDNDNNDDANNIGICSMQLTPGTQFMNEINVFLVEYAIKLKKRYNNIDVDTQILSSNLPDEGEIKIFNLLHEHCELNPHHSNLVVGNDADLIVIAMTTDVTYNIDVMIHLQSEHYIVSTKKLCELYSLKIFDYNLAYLNKNARSDFCMISIMNGNDYLPKLYYTSFDSLWTTYYHTRKNLQSTLTKNGKFNVSFLKDMMMNINCTISKQFRTFSLDKFNPNKIKKYLEGLIWCLNMYTFGYCPDYSYIYEYAKGVTPIEIYYYLELCGINEIDVKITQTKPLSTNSCMVLLLPKKMKSLLPDNIIKFVDKEFSAIGLYEEEECEICDNFKKQKIAKQKEYQETGNLTNKKEIAQINGHLLKHRETHGPLSLDIINKVINIVDNL